MVPAVWVSTVAFDLLRRNGEPLSVLASSRIDPAIHYSNLRRITISHVAAGFPGIVWHVPRRVELLVEWQVLQRMPVMLLRLGSNGEQDEQRDGISHDGLRMRETDRYESKFDTFKSDSCKPPRGGRLMSGAWLGRKCAGCRRPPTTDLVCSDLPKVL